MPCFTSEWDQSSGRVLSLRDDDSQSVIEGEWRKINTLSHYKVRILMIVTLSYGLCQFASLTLQCDLAKFAL